MLATVSPKSWPRQTLRRLAAIALLTATASLAALPAQAQERLLRTLTATGRGTEIVEATEARVNLGVEVNEASAEAAQQEVAKRASAVVAFLRGRNVRKLQTSQVFLSPVYTSDQAGRQRVTGFVGTNTVSFEVDSDAAGGIADGAVRAGATRIGGMEFFATSEAIATARTKALAAAARDAQQQADSVLASLGLTRQEIVTLQIEGAYAPPVLFRERAAAAPAVGDVSPTIGGEQSIQASVTMTVRY